MGVRGLLNHVAAWLSDLDPEYDLEDGMAIGIDASVLIHVLLYRHSSDLVLNQKWDRFESDARDTLQRIGSWIRGTVKLLLVFDGVRLEAKLANAARERSRSQAKESLQSWQEEQSKAPPNTLLRQVVGAFAKEAVSHMQSICEDLGCGYFQAPTEAECQLVLLQRQKIIDCILTNDSDFIALGATNVIFSNRLWHGQCRLWDPSELLNSHLSMKCESPDLRYIVDTCGLEALQLFCCFVTNDYCDIPGVGPASAAKACAAVCRALQSKNEEFSFTANTLALISSQLATNKRRKTEAGRVARVSAADIARAAERAYLMFSAPLVTNPHSYSIQMLSIVPALHHTESEVAELVGMAHFADWDAVKVKAFSSGCFSLSTLKPLRDASPSLQVPTNITAAGSAIGDNDALEEVAMSDTDDIVVLNKDNAPTEAELDRMKVTELRQLLQDYNRPATGNKHDLLAAAKSMVKAARNGVHIPKVDADWRKLIPGRLAQEKLDWEILRRAGWQTVTVEDAPRLLPRLSQELVNSFFDALNADTLRNVSAGRTRFVAEVSVLTGDTAALHSPEHGLDLTVKELFVHGVIKRSVGGESAKRDILAQLTVSGDTVLGIKHVHCLLPEKSVTSEELTFAKAYVACRASKDGACVHSRALLTRIMELKTPGSTDGACAWKRSTNSRISRQCRPADVHNGCRKRNQVDLLPFTAEGKATIQKGPADPAYRDKIRAYIRAVKKAYLSEGGTQELRRRPLAIEPVYEHIGVL